MSSSSSETESLVSFSLALHNIDERLQHLPFIVKRGVEDFLNELHGRFSELAMAHVNPQNCDAVRKLDPSLQRDALRYLLTPSFIPGTLQDPVANAELEHWREWLCESEAEPYIRQTLKDHSIKSPTDLLAWLRCHCRKHVD